LNNEDVICHCKAADFFDAVIGEAETLRDYQLLKAKSDDYEAFENEVISETSGDEINHLLKYLSLAIVRSGLKIAPDGMDKVCQIIQNAIDGDE
jgi:hypothetical protein